MGICLCRCSASVCLWPERKRSHLTSALDSQLLEMIPVRNLSGCNETDTFSSDSVLLLGHFDCTVAQMIPRLYAGLIPYPEARMSQRRVGV